MARLILFVFLFILSYFVLRLFTKKMKIPGQRARQRSEPEELVQDPYCQSYIAKRLAIRKKVDGRDFYFCGQGCLENFLRTDKKERIRSLTNVKQIY